MSLQITYEVFFSQPNSFLATIMRLPTPKTRLNSISLLPSSYSGWLAPRNSTIHFSTTTVLYCQTLSYNHFVRATQKEACLFIRCLTMDVLLLRAYACTGICLPSRCLAVDLYITIFSNSLKFHIIQSILRPIQREDLH
jgi:hypothetical protein